MNPFNIKISLLVLLSIVKIKPASMCENNGKQKSKGVLN